ncbi:MAG: flagellar filament capping protein FliD [Sulfuricella sp.]|jgi:hypothetical protein|nr:flagellar filament capping protein FliD [Sulfuricella sp.]
MNISPVSISLMKAQALSSLMGSAFGAKGDDSWAAMFSLLASNGAQFDQLSSDPLSLLTQSSYINPSGSIKGLSPTGRNMALFDPESAYKMMTVINNDDVSYKAQFSELSQMKSAVFQMQDAGQGLGSIALSTGNDSIKAQMQDFVGQYNSFIQRFNTDIQQGGLLADTQAAQASRFELEQNVNNRFFGIKDGVHGLSDLGITIDPNTRLASLDTARLDSLLEINKQGVANTVREFSANFSKSASLLNSDGNFILKQLDNLNRAIHFIADNKASLQTEFGTGNAAKPAGQVAQALAAYNQTYGA